MDPPEEELLQIASWLNEEGLAQSTKEAQLCMLWRSLQRTRGRLSGVSRDLETQRSQHSAEMAEVRKSLEQIRIFTEHKDVLAQEIQDENDQLKDQLRRLISLQDAQVSEVAKMLYQQGLTELIHSSPSEQVAYLLVERASLLESNEVSNHLTSDGNTVGPLGRKAQMLSSNTPQAEAQRLTGQADSVQRECSRLERDLEEGSRRLAMAHTEIRRLTDELESAHLTQKTYEPELQAAQQEVEQLRQEVEKLKKYEMVELRKAKELNDRLDLEIRALRSRVRTLDAEKGSLQQKIISLQRKVERLELALQEQQQQAEQKILTVKAEASQANEFAKSQVTELIHRNEICKDLEDKLSAQSRYHLEQESEIYSLKQQLDHSYKERENRIAAIYKEKTLPDKMRRKQEEKAEAQNAIHKDLTGFQEALKKLSATQDECETLKKEICESLKSLDRERSKNHDMKERHKTKQLQSKQKFDDETFWRDERISNLERELSLCSHSLAKEKELTISITVENDKLLVERRRLLQQLNEEEHNRKELNLTASFSKCRLDFLEMENKTLRKKIYNMSNQFAVMERSLPNMKSRQPPEDLKTISYPIEVYKTQPSSVKMPEPSEFQDLFDDTQTKQLDVTHSPCCSLPGPQSRSLEMGYLNLTSSQTLTDHSAATTIPKSSDSMCS